MIEDALEKQRLLDESGFGQDDMSDTEFRLAVLELLSYMIMMFHWIRGTFNSMFFHKLVVPPNDIYKNNYNRLEQNLSIYEKNIWELLPSRAFAMLFQHVRKGNKLPNEFQKMKLQDPHGRIPEGTDKDTVELLRTLVRLIEATRNEKLDDVEDLLRRLGEVSSE